MLGEKLESASVVVVKEMASNRPVVALVTGANKGIGYEICKGLAQREGIECILAARDESRGRAAQEQLQKDGIQTKFHQLDITSDQSVSKITEWIRSEYDGKLDILVNNAGFAYHGSTFGVEEAQNTLDVNYFGSYLICILDFESGSLWTLYYLSTAGTKRITDSLLPFIRAAKGRIVNVCSQSGKLSQVARELQEQFIASDLDRAGLDRLMNKFIEDIQKGIHKQEGWSDSMYGISKLGEIAYTMILAREEKGNHVLVNACCPGYCSTDMSSHKGPRSPVVGAETPIMLALFKENEVRNVTPSYAQVLPKHTACCFEQLTTGGFYYDRRPIGW
eukprot:gb/GECG01010780.1/.p1 GENE.gb/GECG01010780.1/~~gb/GECG01010780.1/.p1  ORF type:complete len:334 (+),score=37.56 gb/GECG01010780.1/:1-1002(+)